MGASSPILPDAVLRRMSPEDRKKLRKAGVTAEEAQASFVAKNERELQGQIGSMLHRRGIWYDWDTTHRRRVGTLGTPDFLFCYLGKAVAWEVKFAKGKLRPEQESARQVMLSNGWHWSEIRSYQDALDALREIEGL